jgi:deoxyribodipyrimidine photo-lyase
MGDLSSLIAVDDPRHEVFRDGPADPDGRCVLLWVQRAKRAAANPAANLAVHVADRLGLPVVGAFSLVPAYPRATLRSYHFMAEGLRELPDAFNARGIGWALRVGEPAATIPALATELGAALVVTDQDPLRLGRQWRRGVAERLGVPLVAVDTDTVAPPALFPKEEWAAHTFRPKLWRAIEAGDYLAAIPDPRPAVVSEVSRMRDGPDPLALLDTLPLDRSVGPSPLLRGGRDHAFSRLERFVRDRLAAYHTERDRADREGQSVLGAYLHFGQIGPVDVARAVIAARDAAREAASREATTHDREPEAPDAGPDAFLDELITHRELSVNFALRNPAYDRYEGLPDWGRRTLAEHAADPRPVRYTRAQLDAGETADRLWNAAQRQMVAEGYMPNRLRMYWAKQILLWTESPEEAYDATMTMNDRYFLCGRDPAGYANVAWAIGGRHDRPFPPNKPVLGLVRPLGLNGMRRKFDVDAYIALIERRLGEPIPPLPRTAP